MTAFLPYFQIPFGSAESRSVGYAKWGKLPQILDRSAFNTHPARAVSFGKAPEPTGRGNWSSSPCLQYVQIVPVGLTLVSHVDQNASWQCQRAKSKGFRRTLHRVQAKELQSSEDYMSLNSGRQTVLENLPTLLCLIIINSIIYTKRL